MLDTDRVHIFTAAEALEGAAVFLTSEVRSDLLGRQAEARAADEAAAHLARHGLVPDHVTPGHIVLDGSRYVCGYHVSAHKPLHHAPEPRTR